jgi:hypothetical protein
VQGAGHQVDPLQLPARTGGGPAHPGWPVTRRVGVPGAHERKCPACDGNGQTLPYTGQYPTGYPPCEPCAATGVVPIMVPAISLWQPWASLIFTGDKLHETRAYPPPAKHLGQRIAIHAAKRLPTRDEVGALLGIWCDRTWGAGDAWRASVPRGAILGTAVLVEAIRTDHRQPGPTDLIAGNWNRGRWAWLLGDVRKLDTPLPWAGKQGWFAVPEEALAA